MKRVLVLFALALCSMWALALPTVEEVQTATQQGRYAQAETMMKEVLTARPNSAKGHYIYAEILAHNGKRELALQEVQLARQLDPDLKFTEPEKFRRFEQSLQTRTSASGAVSAPVVHSAPAASRGIPTWVWGIGGLLIAILVWRMVSRRAQAPAYGMAGNSPNMPYNGGPMGGPMMGGGGSGSGMLGAGLAGVGGFAAGMLAEKLIHGNPASAAPAPAPDNGLTPGYFDNDRSGSNDSIDFGNGGDWGGDSASSSDGGGGDW